MIKNIRAGIYTHLISCICIIYYISIIIKNTMNYNFEYLDIILFAAIAAFVVLRLRGMLGRRTGYQKKPRSYFNNGTISNNNEEELKNKNLNLNLNFDEDAKNHFLQGAKMAYEMIVTSFAKGDKSALKTLLSKEIYEDFSKSIDERKSKKLKSETTFIGVKSANIENFTKNDNIYNVTVQFVSEIIICLKDKNNKVVEGNPDTIKTVNDSWKFSKNMWSQNPNWYLIETLQ